MTDPVTVVRRFYEAFNAGDLETYAELLTEDVEVKVDVHDLQGRAAVCSYAAGIRHTFPGITAVIERIVSDGAEQVVTELRQDGPGESWRLAGTVCELIRVRDGRVAAVRSYYAAHPDDRTTVAEMPSRNEAYRIADDRAALRRVAALVSPGVPESEVFTAVNEEIGGLVRADATSLFRFEPDDTMTLLAAWNRRGVPQPIGERQALNDELLEVRASGAAWRFAYIRDDAPFVEEVTELGLRSAVGVPIPVGDHVWGIVFAATERAEPLPADTEERIAGFAELAAAALANAQTRARLEQLAEEQAALRRVAEAVVRGPSRAHVLQTIATEAHQLLGVDVTTVAELTPEGHAMVVALHGAPAGMAVGDCGPPPGVSDAAEAPIVVDSAPWGTLSVLQLGGPLPVGVEERLADFAALAGAAIFDADARTALRGMADEQAALRRVAELVARGVAPDELFASVAREASKLVADEATTLLRFDDDGCATVLATHGGPAPVGSRFPVSPDDESTPGRILRTGRPARQDDYAAADRPDYAREYRVGSSVGAPVIVEDRVWGMLGATTPDRRLPDEAERRLHQFAELVAAALANAQARAELQHLADEQAALRRVAELVADGLEPAVVLDAVVVEASRLLGDAGTALSRYEPEGDAIVVASCRSPAPVGLRVPVEPGTAHGEVLRTGSPYRVTSFSETPLAVMAERLGVDSAVGVPVIVEGRVWGLLSSSVPGRPPPARAEGRLAQFARLIGTAIANAEGRAQLTASRARVVAAADESRRQVQRDVHDGAQQRLVQTIITLKLARQALSDGSDTAPALLAEALVHADRASSELRDLVRGILPASLSRGGLRAGVESLAGDLPLPVDVRVTAPRLEPATETTAYFVVAEALTNVVKHARATSARVRADLEGDVLRVEVTDDGVGGAKVDGGTGLTGLFDRVEAGEGTLVIDSPAGRGTTVRACLPARAGA